MAGQGRVGWGRVCGAGNLLLELAGKGNQDRKLDSVFGVCYPDILYLETMLCFMCTNT